MDESFRLRKTEHGHSMSSVSIRSVTAGNWISKVLVTKLGMNNEIKPISHSPRARDYHGKRVVADGTISFRRKHREGTTIHDPVEFYVGRHFPDDMDMIFGRAYMTEKRLPRVNRSRMLPIFAHKKKDRGEWGFGSRSKLKS